MGMGVGIERDFRSVGLGRSTDTLVLEASVPDGTRTCAFTPRDDRCRDPTFNADSQLFVLFLE